MDTAEKNEQQGALVLIVDDVPKNLQVLGTILKSNGFKVNFVQSGKQALEVLKDRQPEIILLDVSMPEMSGFEVCKTLKETPEYRDIPVIFLTARTESEDIITGFKVGGVDLYYQAFQLYGTYCSP